MSEVDLLKEAGLTLVTQEAAPTEEGSTPNANEGQQPPAATPPPIPQENTPAPKNDEPPAFDPNNWVKEQFGETYKNVDELKAKIDRANKLENVASHYTDLEKRYKQLEKDHDEVFADDFLKAANDFVKKEGSLDVFLEVNRLDLDKMSPIELIKKEMQLTKKHLTLDEIEQVIEERYKLDEDPDSKEYKRGQILLKDDAQEKRNSLGKYKVDMSVPPLEKNKAAREVESRNAQLALENDTRQWSSLLDKAIPDIKRITLPLNEEGLTYEFEFKDIEPDKLKAEALGIITAMRLPVNEHSVEVAKNVILSGLKEKNFNALVIAAAKKMKETTEAELDKQIHNPSAGKLRGDVSGTNSPKSFEDQMADAYVNARK